jgi:hypothetical protein
MRLREFIQKSKDDLRGDLIRAIDLANDGVDIQQVVALISSAVEELDDDDILFIQDYLDKKIGYLKPEPHLRKVNP